MINKTLVRVAITGINGKMGNNLIKTIIKFKQVLLGAVLTYRNSDLNGMDVGDVIGIKKLNLKISNDFKSEINNFDVLIDFTNPDSSLKYLKCCLKYKKNIVIGTTGFNKKQKCFIKQASSKIGIFMSNNFSIGMNLILRFLKKINLLISPKTDIEIIDMHHRGKKDKVSGTALDIKEKIYNSMKLNDKEKKFLNKNSNKIIKNNDTRLNLTSIRIGDIIGEHTIIFANSGEQIEVSHKVINRMIFAKGAIHAARWLKGKKGFFCMQDIIDSDNLKF